MLFFWYIILLHYYSLIYRKNLYVNVTNYNNIDIFTKLIYCTHTCAYIYILNKWLQIVTDYNYIHFVYIRTHIYTYMIYIIHVRTYIHNNRLQIVTDCTYIHFINIMCQNCTKLYLNYLKYHFNFNTLTICVSLNYNT